MGATQENTIADLYKPETMPQNLREAHDFPTKMTSQQTTPKKSAKRKPKGDQ